MITKKGTFKAATFLLIAWALLVSYAMGLTLAALASDITNAEYRTTVTFTNADETATGVAGTWSLNTTDMIDGNMLAANASDAALLSGGIDVAFMPSANDTYPWCAWITTIAEDADLSMQLMSGNVSGGKICYFAGAAGMSANDSASLELGDNFTIVQSGYFDTAQDGVNLVLKPNAFRTYISGSGNITSAVTANVTNSQQNGSTILFDIFNTKAGHRYNSFPAVTVSELSFKLWKLGSPTGTADITIRAVSGDTVIGTIGTMDVTTLTTDGAWYDFNDLPVVIPSQQDVRFCFEWEGGDVNNKIYVGYQNADVISGQRTYYDPAVWTDGTGDGSIAVRYVANSVTATGISSGEHTVTATANVTHLLLTVDGSLKDSTALTANVTDNSENWTFIESAAMPYMEYHTVTINGTVTQNITWQYDDYELADLSGQGNHAYPTFRTAPSDADVTGAATAQEGIIGNTSPTAANVSGGWTLLDETPTAPAGLFTEGSDSYGVGDFNIGEVITDTAEDAYQDATTWHYIVAFGLSTLFFALAYGASHETRTGRRGSLMLAVFVAAIPLIFFYREGTIFGWLLIPYGLLELFLIAWRRSPSPVD